MVRVTSTSTDTPKGDVPGTSWCCGVWAFQVVTQGAVVVGEFPGGDGVWIAEER
jgi:hypothetical protein